MKTIAIIGGGPAGSMTAERLLSNREDSKRTSSAEEAVVADLQTRPYNFRVMVFEERRGWEKPCGGGLSHKAIERYAFLSGATAPSKAVRDLEITAPGGASVRLRLREPLLIYSRRDLNALLLDRARQAGAEVLEERVTAMELSNGGWQLTGRKGVYGADFVVLAAGARTRLRQELAGDLAGRDFMMTFGYYVPKHEDLLRLEFYQDFEGYAWSFPRLDHLSVGICSKVGQSTMAELREKLHDFMRRFGLARDRATTYSHLLPSLEVESWNGLRLAGNGWALAGDAAGLVDPITGEGIYFAMRSGEILAESLRSSKTPKAARDGGAALSARDYSERLRREFGEKLELGARLVPHFYRSDFLGGPVTARMVQFAARSGTFRELFKDMIESRQSYPGLASRLYRGLPKSLFEIAFASFREKLFNA